MATTIGYLAYNPDKDQYSGKLATLAIQSALNLVPRAKTSDKQPDYTVFGNNGAECGAAWKKTNEAGNEYVSIKLDDPSLPMPIYANLGRAAGQDDDNTFAIIWNHSRT